VLTIHERLLESGERETVDVGAEDGALVVRVAGESTLLPMSVLEAVMARYGKPLEDGVPLPPGAPSVDLGDGGVLRLVRILGFYDVIAKDFLVWEPRGAGREPLAELATSVSAALVHFVRAASAGIAAP